MRLTLATLALALLAGCGGMTGDNIVKYERGTVPFPPTEAPSTASYGLFYATDANPWTQYPLRKGDKLGFFERNGKVFGVAGRNQVPIKTTPLVRTVYWRRMVPRE